MAYSFCCDSYHVPKMIYIYYAIVIFLDQRKQAKMQWIQDSSQSNVDILNNLSKT